MNMKIKKIAEGWNDPTFPIPENGLEARSCMLFFRDEYQKDYDKRLKKDFVRKYELARRLALIYKMDISNLPEKLDNRGNKR